MLLVLNVFLLYYSSYYYYILLSKNVFVKICKKLFLISKHLLNNTVWLWHCTDFSAFITCSWLFYLIGWQVWSSGWSVMPTSWSQRRERSCTIWWWPRAATSSKIDAENSPLYPNASWESKFWALCNVFKILVRTNGFALLTGQFPCWWLAQVRTECVTFPRLLLHHLTVSWISCKSS